MEDHKATPNSKDLTGQVKLIDPTPVFVGNYSWVFRGKLGNRIVGVKVIQATGSTESTKRKKVLREHLVWETLDDPHILEFLGYANDTGFNKFGAFISPWCSNGNVTQFLSDHGDALAPFEKIALWKGVVKGVAYLHGRVPPIIHGDLKPGNILIGDDGKPKLCDFGLVRIFLEESQSGLTTTSAHTGTERYLAPELVTYDEEDEAGHIVPTLESDIYALGCVGMVIIYGQQPFNKRKNNLQGRLISDIKKGLPPFPRSAARILFIEYPWDLLSECWCWNPHSRPTASRLLEARLFILRLTATPLARILRLSAQSYIEMENQDGGAQWRQQAGYLANMCLVSRPWCAHAIPLLLWYLGADGSSIVDMDNPVHTPWEDFIIDYARTVKGSAYRRQHRSSEVKSRSPETYVSGIVDRPQNQSKHSIGYEHLATALESVIPPMPSTVAAMRTEIQENSTQSLKFLASDGGGVPTRSLDSIQWTNEPSEYLGTFADTLSHIHTALSPQLSTRHTPRTGPLPETAVDEGRMDLETTRPSPPILPARRTPFRGFTATSVDENSDNEWDRTANHQPHTRHHPYQPHHPTHKRPQLSISPSYSRRSPTHSAYSQSYDDTRAFVPASASSGASANASADEGPNSNSYYDGNFPVASPSTTPSIFTFIRGGKRNSHHNYGMPDGPSPAGRPGVSAGNGGGGQSTAQLSLESLPSYPPDQKPPFSYPLLIRLAILGSPQKRLLSSQIFSAIEDKFPWYRDSAPTNWKSSVRHCLSLNKEFIRTQRALEDPGVGHGGFKRPRKRRPAQPRRSEHELDPIPITETSAATRLAIRRRHSTTFEDSLTADSSMLPPLHIPKPTHPLPTPPFSSSKFVSGRLRSGTEGDGRVRRKYPHGYSISGSYARPGGTHPPNASPSPSYSAYGYCSESSVSSCSRPNPMSISSLLNDRGPSNVAAAIAERLDKMDIDMDEPRRISIQPKIEYDVEILHEKEKAVFSSEQTLRPASPSDIPPQSHIRGSASPSHDEHTVLTRRTTPLHFVATSSPSKGSTATREREKKSTGGERSAKSTRSARASKSWASSMDLSVMEPEYESESE